LSAENVKSERLFSTIRPNQRAERFSRVSQSVKAFRIPKFREGNMNIIKSLKSVFAFVLGTAVLLIGVATATAQDYHEKMEKRDLKRHQQMEREYYGNSRELKRHQKMEKEQLKYEQKLERRGYYVQHQQYDNGYYNQYDPFYSNRGYETYGYYDK